MGRAADRRLGLALLGRSPLRLAPVVDGRRTQLRAPSSRKALVLGAEPRAVHVGPVAGLPLGAVQPTVLARPWLKGRAPEMEHEAVVRPPGFHLLAAQAIERAHTRHARKSGAKKNKDRKHACANQKCARRQADEQRPCFRFQRPHFNALVAGFFFEFIYISLF